MRKGCLAVVAVILLLIAAPIVYLFVTIPSSVPPVAMDATGERLAMLRLVPADATEIFVVPAAGGFYRQLRDHPVTAPAIARWQDAAGLRQLPLLLGGADVVGWRRGSELSYLIAPDPLRRFLLRTYLSWNRSTVTGNVGNFILVGPPPPAALAPQSLQSLIALTRGMSGQAFVIETGSSSWNYPPIARPAVSTAVFDGGRLTVVSRAVRTEQLVAVPAPFLFYPEEAMLSASSSSVGDWLQGLDRLLPVKLSPLLQKGALVSLYKVDKGRLLPRLRGLAVVPEGPDTDQLIALLDATSGRFSFGGVSGQGRTYRGIEIVRREGLGFVIEYARNAGRVLVAFDKSSIEDYVNDALTPVAAPPGQTIWFLRVRPGPLVPVLDQLRDRQELTLLAPEIYRTIGDLQMWLDYVQSARSILMIRQVDGEWDELTATAEK
ncbi:MAG: hypothetical protein ABI718_18585 [Acidobacteriota bacterium]